MSIERRRPADLARAMAGKSRRSVRAQADAASMGWRRETYTLSRQDARDKAREWFDRFPKAAYMTEVEFWRELPDGQIEFTIRRLPSAD